MLRKANNPAPTTHGVTAHMLAHQGLYETRRGMFGGHTPLFDPNAPVAQPATPAAPAAPATPAASTEPGTGTDALNRALAGLLGRHGSTDAVALHLLNENHTLREQRRTLSGQIPAEGSVVLTPEQAQQWQAYQQLGPDPAALRTRLTHGDQALEREQGRQYAEISGANAEVLSDRLRASGLRAEIRETPSANGAAPTRALHLIQPGANGAADTDLGDVRAYAQQHWTAYASALFPAAQGAQGQQGITVAGQAGPSAGTQQPANPMAAALNSGAAPAGGVISAFSLTPLTPQGGTQ